MDRTRREKLEFANQQKKTHIAQLVGQNPEMPEEIELNKDRRKQLAELMLGYPTKAAEEENPASKQEDEKILRMPELRKTLQRDKRKIQPSRT